MLTTLYRRLRNLDTIADLRHQLASLSARIDLMRRNSEHTTYRNHLLEGRNRELMRVNLAQAEMIESMAAQLTVCRAMLAATMRDRDAAEERALRMRQKWVRERKAIRLWVTRAGACEVGRN